MSNEFVKFIKREFKDEENLIDINILLTILFPKFQGLKKIDNIQSQRYNRWKGFLNSSSKITIMQAFSLSESRTLKILTNFFCINWKAIHDIVWKERCEMVIDKEQKLGITVQIKRNSSYKDIRLSNKNQLK